MANNRKAQAIKIAYQNHDQVCDCISHSATNPATLPLNFKCFLTSSSQVPYDYSRTSQSTLWFSFQVGHDCIEVYKDSNKNNCTHKLVFA
jgi:hypothetical protein